jgi:predicted nucleotide-binding protein/O-acetyl-ADP-ribose deacetylase (regulator of RNase III)
MKPQVFLGSSTESKPMMYTVANWLREWNLDPLPWDSPGLFGPGDYILTKLLEISEKVDGALMIFGEEDKHWYHSNAQPRPRDNVMIEYGIFASHLGPRRAVVCRKGNPKTASDLGGLVFIQFGNKKQNDDAKERLQYWAKDLPDLVVQGRQLEEERRKAEKAALPSREDAVFSLPSNPERTIKVITGSLRDIRDVDVIVSSENTDLQPSRYYDPTMSGTLRYLDAEKNEFDLRVTRDAYLDSLEAAKLKADVRVPVQPGAVIVAPTTGLRQQHVKYVFHAATVQGAIETGYSAREDVIDQAIRNCFRRFSDLCKIEILHTILLPVFGGGTGGLGPDTVARRMIAAIEDGMNEHDEVRQVVMFARIEAHRRALRAAAEAAGWPLKGRG